MRRTWYFPGHRNGAQPIKLCQPEKSCRKTGLLKPAMGTGVRMRSGTNAPPTYPMMGGAGCVVGIYTNRIDDPGIPPTAIRGKASHQWEAVTASAFDADHQDLLSEHGGPGHRVLALRHASDADGNTETMLRLGGFARMLQELSLA